MSESSNQKAFQDPVFSRTMLIGLVIDCPLRQSSETCPFAEVRDQPVSDRIRWVEDLPDDQCVGYYQRHLTCLKGRCRQSIAEDEASDA